MSLSKNTAKFVKALHLKKYRQKYNKFIAEGSKIVLELLAQSRYSVVEVFAIPAWAHQHAVILEQFSVPLTLINAKELGQISRLNTPNQVLAIVNKKEAEEEIDFSADWSIYLDGLQDPGNVGTILRIADWFAIPNVIFGPGTVDLYNYKTLQATMGAFMRVRCLEVDLATVVKAHPKLACWGADMGGDDIFATAAPTAGVLVIGNEGRGLRAETRTHLSQVVAIKAPQGSGAESLNAGVACGIMCAALRRETEIVPR